MSETTGTEMTEKAENTEERSNGDLLWFFHVTTPFLRCSVLSAFSASSVPVTSAIPVSTIVGSSL
jgi:hypothetical protein